MRSLSSLPDELLVHIAILLSHQDVLSLRATSRNIEKACFDHFARRFFRKKGFMITTDSLTVLESIANHDALNSYVQHVWYNPDCFTFVVHSDNPPLSRTSRTIAQYQEDHAALLNGPQLTSWLSRMFRQLPNLKTLGMRRGTEHSPSGWSRLQYAAGQDPRILGHFERRRSRMILEPSLLFVAILKALKRSNARVRRFYTDAVVDVTIRPLLSPQVLHSACSSIQYLEINLIGRLPEGEPDLDPEEDEDEEFLMRSEPPTGFLKHWLQVMPDLRELGMTLFQDHKQRHMMPPQPHDLQSWREAYPFKALQHIEGIAFLSQLRRVKLEKICTTEPALTSILHASSGNLMSLKLRQIHLLSDESPPPNNINGEIPQPWQAFFQFLAHECHDLEYVLLHWLSVDGTTVRFQQDHTTFTSNIFGEINAVHTPIPADRRAPMFADYDNLTVEVFGREEVHKRISDLAAAHWSGTKLLTNPMDESVWHTDTSDEDW